MSLDGIDIAALIRVDLRVASDELRRSVTLAVSSVADLVTVAPGGRSDVVVTDQPPWSAGPAVAIVAANRIDEALAAGAAFALPIDAGPDAVRAAIRAAHSGLTGRLREAPPRALHRLDGHDEEGTALSPREVEVLALLAQGASNKLIARRLDISVHTAKFHVGSIMTKLAASTRTDAVARGMRLGLVLL